ncbi:MAG TPA: hypothetical protein VG708_14490 [Mycobacteriales bacterium]|nr:hypothetical protein [Mycobacteriales bacterium]
MAQRTGGLPPLDLPADANLLLVDPEAGRVPSSARPVEPNTHVVVVVRPLASLLPRYWQQAVSRGGSRDYDAWLRWVLDDSPDGAATPFRRRHAYGDTVRRWVDAVGSAHVTVAVTNDAPAERRLLTAAEGEALRRIDPDARPPVLKAWRRRKPSPDEAAVTTPDWATRRAAAIGAELVSEIQASGVRVVGDLGLLTDAGESPAPDPAEGSLPVDAAAAAVVGALAAIAGPREQSGRVRSLIWRIRRR